MREVEEVVGIVGGFDGFEAREVGAVVGLLPVGEVGVDVVLVGLAVGVGTHSLPDIGEPGMVGRDGCSGITGVPTSGILRGEEGVAVNERGRVGADAVDSAAVSVHADAALAE